MQFSDEVYIQQFLKCLRQAIIKEQILCLDYFEVIFQDEDYLRKINKILELTEDFKGTVFILSEASTRGIIKAHKKSVALFLDIPDGLTRKTLWDYYTAQLAGQLEIQVDLNVIANKYLLTPKQIRNAAQDLNNIVLSKKGSKAVTEEDINQACLNQILSKLSEKGTKIKPFYTFDDIVIEDNQRRMLMDICNRVKYKHKVYEEWGFNKKIPYGRGLTVLFSGPPGTGKTMSSEVIANEIGLELYKVEVPQIISKYVGETEKNLKEIFSEAKNSNAILFFDEADAIFGKRSEVKSSQDRYAANIEVAYLLQEMEAYEGITILATNLQENIDEVFFRRIQFHVQFTMPDRELRKKIWLKLIPPEAPLSEDIDFDFLAQKYELSGGNIKNIVVSSAFQAAATNSKISMKLILNAVKDELQKNGKIFTKEDFGEYSFLVYN
ncbi:MAG: ATP-binding protein [Clostridia bacterium]|nr:ATP-binding protein [Clostridia bacterium]